MIEIVMYVASAKSVDITIYVTVQNCVNVENITPKIITYVRSVGRDILKRAVQYVVHAESLILNINIDVEMTGVPCRIGDFIDNVGNVHLTLKNH